MWLGGEDVPGEAPSPTEWITAWSKYNVVRNANFGRAWAKRYGNDLSILYGNDFDNEFGQLCVQGGARDPPTPMLYSCRATTGCEFVTVSDNAARLHWSVCTPQSAMQLSKDIGAAKDTEQPTLTCPHDGCTYSVALAAKNPKACLARHIRAQHELQAKPCEYGCNPLQVYKTAAYALHIAAYHPSHPRRNTWPAPCPFQGCCTAYMGLETFRTHLAKKHSVAAEDMAKYEPQTKPKTKFVRATCVEPGCTWTETTRLDRYKNHLSKTHQKNDDEIQQLVEANAVFEDRSTKATSSRQIQRKKLPDNGC